MQELVARDFSFFRCLIDMRSGQPIRQYQAVLDALNSSSRWAGIILSHVGPQRFEASAERLQGLLPDRALHIAEVIGSAGLFSDDSKLLMITLKGRAIVGDPQLVLARFRHECRAIYEAIAREDDSPPPVRYAAAARAAELRPVFN